METKPKILTVVIARRVGVTHFFLFSRSVQIFLICEVIFNGTKVSVLGFELSFSKFSKKFSLVSKSSCPICADSISTSTISN